jgi:hypothetical protein
MSLEDTPGTGCGGVGSTEGICQCLDCALAPLTAAVLSIAEALKKPEQDACKDIDKCTDKILENIKKKIEGPVYSCDKCKAMIANGQGGTLEYAVRCAAQKCDDCVESCSSEGQAINEGKCCKNCQGENCTCKGGSCVPTEEEPQQPKGKYVGWCHLEDGVIAVTKQGASPPGVGFSQVGLAETEQGAIALAEANCGVRFDPQSEQPEIPTSIGGTPSCDLNAYFTGEAFGLLNSQGVFANLEAGTSQAAEAASRINVLGLGLDSIPSLIHGIWQSWAGFDSAVSVEMLPNLAKSLGCGSSWFVESAKALSAISRVGSYAGFDPTEFTTQYRYQMNAACRRRLLTPDEAMASYLANGINDLQLDQHFAIAGICPDPVRQKLQASKSKMIPLQLAVARRRLLITPERYSQGMRELGYIDETVPETLFKLTEQVPPMSEIIRYMVRDADDTQLVQQFGLDDFFEQKYGGQLKKWSADQGISEQQARYSWRSHWNIPAPGQLLTFWHRLRYNPKFGGKDKMLADIKAAMVQQDILPHWHDYYLAVSFRPMRLVDIRRSFQIGSLSDAELVPAYLDLGYSDETAEKMAAFTRRLRDRAVQTSPPVKQWLTGQITKNQATALLTKDNIPISVINEAMSIAEPNFDKSVFAKAFIRGDISKQQLSDALSTQGVSSSAINQITAKLSYQLRTDPIMDDYEAGIVDRAEASAVMTANGMNQAIASKTLDRIDHHLKLQNVKQCINGIKQRYLTGELTKVEAENELVGRGVKPQRANETVNWWGCQLKSESREPSASMLCEWLSRGAITTVQFVDRLKRIGYSESDAAMMLEDCLLRANAKVSAKAMKEAKEETANQRRISRALAQQARHEAAYYKYQENFGKQQAKLRASREKSLLTAAATLANKCECDIYAALQFAKDQSSSVQANYGLSIDRTLQILNLAANEWGGGMIADAIPIINAMADTAVKTDLNQGAEVIAPDSLTNGNVAPV